MQKKLCYLFPLVHFFSIAFADTIPYSIHRYTDENGLPQNSVKYIVPDASGFLWLGTEDGLVKFSGHGFTTYNRQYIPISSNRISHIVPGAGALYAVTHTKDIIAMKDGQVVSVRNHTMPLREREAGMPVSLSRLYSQIRLSNLHRAVREDTFFLPVNEQVLYRITQNSVHYVEQGKEKYMTRMPGADPWRFFLLSGKLYYLSHQGTMLMLQDSLFTKIIIGGDIRNDAVYRASPQSLNIYYGVTGDVLLRIGRSLYRLTQGTQHQPHTELLIDQFDFDKHAIACCYYDHQHNRLFLGSYTEGLFIIDRKPFVTINAAARAADEEVQYAQTVLRGGDVLASFGNVFTRNGTTIHRPLVRKRSDNFSLFTDRQGNIWVKTADTLSHLDSTGEKLLNEWRLPSLISNIYEGKEGAIWICTDETGIFRLNPADPQPKPVPVFPDVQMIRFMQEDDNGILWASALGGLYRLSTSTGKAETIKEFDGMDIRSLYLAAPSELWITTYGDGFFLYRQDTVVQFPLDKHQYLASSHCVVEDARGFFWIPTNKGLFKVARKDLECYARNECRQVYYYYYDRNAGFNTNEFNGGCQPCAIQVNQFFSFPTMNGLVRVNAAETDIEAPDKKIFVESARLDSDSVPVADTFFLPARFSLFTLSVSTPYYGNPHNLLMEYMLSEGNWSKPEWHEVNGEGEITISSIPSGTYDLTIRMRTGFGANNYTYKKVTLVIDTIFYNTWQFTVLAVMLLVFGVWAYTKIRLRYIKHKNDMLQQRIEQDTRELQDTLRQLTQSELNLRKQNRMQELLIASLTHDIKNPLRYLVVMLRHLKEQHADRPQADLSLAQSIHVLYEASYRMYYLTDNLLQYIRLHGRSDQHEINFESFALHELVEQKIAIFRDIARTQSTVVVNEVPPTLTIRSHQLILGIIIHNLLDNAIKFTSEGSILVSAKTEDDHLYITIRDTGIGIEPSTVASYNAYYNLETPSDGDFPLPGHAGLGLVIVREMIRLLRGRVVIESENNYGTLVTIMLPNGQEEA